MGRGPGSLPGLHTLTRGPGLCPQLCRPRGARRVSWAGHRVCDFQPRYTLPEEKGQAGHTAFPTPPHAVTREQDAPQSPQGEFLHPTGPNRVTPRASLKRKRRQPACLGLVATRSQSPGSTRHGMEKQSHESLKRGPCREPGEIMNTCNYQFICFLKQPSRVGHPQFRGQEPGTERSGQLSEVTQLRSRGAGPSSPCSRPAPAASVHVGPSHKGQVLQVGLWEATDNTQFETVRMTEGPTVSFGDRKMNF